MIRAILSLHLAAALSCTAAVKECDVCIYGATSAGISAAIQVQRMGHTVALIEPGTHIGGLSTGGLGATDIGNKAVIGGIAREFYEGIHAHYARPEAWTRETRAQFDAKRRVNPDPVAERTGRPAMWQFEPHVAAQTFRLMMEKAGLKVHTGEWLTAVAKDGATITSITTETGTEWRAKVYIDCTYEGDLMAKAGVRYHVGREANSVYGELHNGIIGETPKHQFLVPVDPFVKPGAPASGLLKWIQPEPLGTPGAGDRSVQAYNYRLCMTRDPDNRLPWIKPDGYRAEDYELLSRLVEAHEKAGKPLAVGGLMHPADMPNRKTDTNNNGAFSTDFIGMNFDYPDGDRATRERIAREHETYIRGLMWHIASSPRIPARLRDEMNSWGLAKDEFTATGGFPPQMYVREARRMISDLVMTEHECRGSRPVVDPAGLGAYNMDSHNCRRIVRDGLAHNEGDVQETVKPYPISLRSILPREGECRNLAVPVCLSASHIAYGSIRMEPVFMILAQTAATAACQSIATGVSIQKVDYPALRSRLEKDGQILHYTPPADGRVGGVN